MAQGPAAFGIHQRVEGRGVLVQNLRGGKAVKAQEPICLIEAVFPQKRWFCAHRGQESAVGNRHICRIKHALEMCIRDRLYSISGKTKDSYNDVGRTEVEIQKKELGAFRNGMELTVKPHSVNILQLL